MYNWECPCRQCNGELDYSDAVAYYEAVAEYEARKLGKEKEEQ